MPQHHDTLKKSTLKAPVFEQSFRNIDDALRKESGCTTELDYTEQTSWLLFLKYLASLEQDKADEAGMSRMWAGIHYRSDIETGLKLGRQVGDLVIEWAKADGSG